MQNTPKIIYKKLLILTPFLALVIWYEINLLTFYFSGKLSTYYAHVQFGLVLAENGELSSPHFLYQLLVIGVANLFYPNGGVPTLERFLSAGYAVSVAVVLLLFFLLYTIFDRAIRRTDGWYPVIPAIMATFFMVASAVNALIFIDGHHYFGYLPLNVYNSPTHSLLKLVALPLFLGSVAIFKPVYSSSKYLIIGIAILSVLTAIAKPSFTIIILPAVALVFLYKLLKKEYINWSLLILGLVLPSIIVLIWQYCISYASGWDDLARRAALASRIALIPFGQFIRWNVPLYLLLPKLLLSILFPLVVYMVYWKSSRKSLVFNLGWLVFIFGCFITYLFVEVHINGRRAGIVSPAGNFTWSGLIGVFTLFVAAAMFWLKQTFDKLPLDGSDRWRVVITIVTLLLHVGFGLPWYFNQFRLFTEKLY